jgi:hypothetical protein
VILFGTPWDAPVCEDPMTEWVPAPVGQQCFSCKVSIVAEDQGLMIPYATVDHMASLEPWHRACFLGSIIGPHLQCG